MLVVDLPAAILDAIVERITRFQLSRGSCRRGDGDHSPCPDPRRRAAVDLGDDGIDPCDRSVRQEGDELVPHVGRCRARLMRIVGVTPSDQARQALQTARLASGQAARPDQLA